MPKVRVSARIEPRQDEQLTELEEHFKKNRTEILEYAIKLTWFHTFVYKTGMNVIDELPRKEMRLYYTDAEET